MIGVPGLQRVIYSIEPNGLNQNWCNSSVTRIFWTVWGILYPTFSPEWTNKFNRKITLTLNNGLNNLFLTNGNSQFPFATNQLPKTTPGGFKRCSYYIAPIYRGGRVAQQTSAGLRQITFVHRLFFFPTPALDRAITFSQIFVGVMTVMTSRFVFVYCV